MPFATIRTCLAGAKAIGCAIVTAAFLVPGVLLAQDGMLEVTGELTYRERIALPPNAVAHVRVEDVSLADAPARIVSEARFAVSSVPLPFTLEVTRAELDDRARYGLRGTITDENGDLLWTTDTFILVEPEADSVDHGTIVMIRATQEGGPMQQVFLCGEIVLLAAIDGETLLLTRPEGTDRLMRERTASGARFVREDGALSLWIKGDEAQFDAGDGAQACVAAPPAAFLTGRKWMVEDIDGGGVIDRSRGSLTFGFDGRLSGLAGCNTYTGEWRADGTILTTSRLAQTRMACLPALARQEAAMLDILTDAERFSFTPNGALVVADTNDRTMTAR